MNKRSSLSIKVVKHIGIFIFSILVLALVCRLGLLIVGNYQEQVALLNKISHSSALFYIRLVTYVGLWLAWPSMMRKIKNDLSDADIKATRKPLIVLVVLYELLIARNLLPL